MWNAPAVPALLSSSSRGLAGDGFTLIEVLVALVLLSFGALGLAGLQASALRLNREAQWHTTAVQLARDYAELIRANPAAHAAYLVAQTDRPTRAPARHCGQVQCTAQERAAWDAHEWQSRVATTLPTAQWAACTDSAAVDAQGRPRWACTGSTSAPIAIKIGWRRTPPGKPGAKQEVQAEGPVLVHQVWPRGSPP
ncbi:MAG: hypothetical protein GAK30_02995 [Paracidovorax wautersii]|uniref:Type IV pilin Tt1218-like domain-containing protein n=1 Tax=Paracidovorax wautersii TaxID=1177982 RepID=A0A7V8JPA1_9BURK|nr:MAG: hypothetical protein GAK30_02995 [Paracidovorax wautersii]